MLGAAVNCRLPRLGTGLKPRRTQRAEGHPGVSSVLSGLPCGPASGTRCARPWRCGPCIPSPVLPPPPSIASGKAFPLSLAVWNRGLLSPNQPLYAQCYLRGAANGQLLPSVSASGDYFSLELPKDSASLLRLFRLLLGVYSKLLVL